MYTGHRKASRGYKDIENDFYLKMVDLESKFYKDSWSALMLGF